MKIKQIFDEIAKEHSTKKKVEILFSHKDNITLKEVLYKAYSKKVKFYIKQIPEYSRLETHTHPLEGALYALNLLSDRLITGNEAIKHLKEVLMCCEKDDAYVIERIIEKDAKIGMAAAFINKVFPNLIEETPYMGAKPFDAKIIKKLFETEGVAYSQIKMDGRYANSIIREGEVDLESRQGEPTILLYFEDDGNIKSAKFVRELEFFENCVLNGELTIPNVSRYVSNGIISSIINISKKIIKGEDVFDEIAKFEKDNGIPYKNAVNSIVYTVWDKISVDEYYKAKSSTNYSERFQNFHETYKKAYEKQCCENESVKTIECKEVFSFEEAMEHFQDMINKGEEGTILKSKKGTWKDGKPNWQIKCKLEMTVDLKIVGFNYGTGKNSSVISSINASSSDNLVFTRPTGINENIMKFITDNQEKLLGIIIEVECNGLSIDSNGNYSLLHPRFKSFRDDKVDCDSLQSIKNIEKMIKGLS